jgi:ATP-dependent Clp protease ATP-binding subunit ClpB
LYQDKAIDALCSSVLRAKSGLRNPDKPIGSFLFLGRTGVGKTHSAKVLSEKFFGSRGNLIQIDMTEYSEKINVSRLTGSAPGYVGYEDGNRLTDKIRDKPYSVILFDEIEKAHPEVLQILLQVLDEGRLTDSSGRAGDFTNSIIIMTGNIGAEYLDKNASVGFNCSVSENNDKILDQAKKILGVEFVNRIDETIIFKDFTLNNIKEMLKKEVSLLKNKISKKHGITLEIKESVLDELSNQAFECKMGARPIKKLIQQNIETIISREIIKNESKKIFIKKLNYT